jgi:hypothetical protein
MLLRIFRPPACPQLRLVARSICHLLSQETRYPAGNTGEDTASAAKSEPTRMAASFKRTDERALAARRSSYAFLKQSEEVVPWAPLSVQGELVSHSRGDSGELLPTHCCSRACVPAALLFAHL